jgi:hypothetical protein
MENLTEVVVALEDEVARLSIVAMNLPNLSRQGDSKIEIEKEGFQRITRRRGSLEIIDKTPEILSRTIPMYRHCTAALVDPFFIAPTPLPR